MAHRVSVSFFKDIEKQHEEVVSPASPLPVEVTGGGSSNTLTELFLNNTPLEGSVNSSTMATPIVQDYTPDKPYEMLWLVVYSEGAPTLSSPIVVKAQIANSPQFVVASATVAGSSRAEIPIPGGYKNYNIWLGDPDALMTSHSAIHWKLFGG